MPKDKAKVQPGRHIRANTIRDLSRYVRQTDPKLFSEGVAPFESFVAITTDHGPENPCDFCDYRYWVRSARLRQVETACPTLGDCTLPDEEVIANTTQAQCIQLSGNWVPYPPNPCHAVLDLNIPTSFAYSGFWEPIPQDQLHIWQPAINIAEVLTDFSHSLVPGTPVVCFPIQTEAGDWFLAFNPGGVQSATGMSQPTEVVEVKIRFVVFNAQSALYADTIECQENPECNIVQQHTENRDFFDENGPYLRCHPVSSYIVQDVEEPDINQASKRWVPMVDQESYVNVFPHSTMNINAFIPSVQFITPPINPDDLQVWRPGPEFDDPVFHAMVMERDGLTLDFGVAEEFMAMTSSLPFCNRPFREPDNG